MGVTAVPARIAALPVDEQRGVPVPWFVAWIDGKPDFRVIESGKIAEAIKFRRCWICGQELGRNVSFVLGPMCGITRTSAEPPSHRDCAIYAAVTCPFLTKPAMRRREKGLPEQSHVAGIMVKRNPGVALVWSTRSWKLFKDPNGGLLIEVGDPDETLWYAEGRPATRAEVEASIESGLPILAAEATGQQEIEELHNLAMKARQYLPHQSVEV